MIISYTVYILQCSDKTLYTGCKNNIVKRVREHNAGKAGAKYTRARRPVRLVYSEVFRTLARGRRREAEIKRMKREEKVKLVQK